MIPTDKRFLAILIIAALFFSITNVMAEDSGSGGSDDSSDSSDNSSDDSSDDNSDDSIDTSPTRDHGSDDIMDDRSGDRMDDSADDSPDAAERETEIEIEHGISTIKTDEGEELFTTGVLPGEGVASTGRLMQPSIMTRSLVSLSSLPGAGPARISELAKKVDDSYSHLSEAERSIRERSGIITFFFGGDDAAADDIQTHVNEDRIALDEMEQMVIDPSSSPALKEFTQARLRIIRADLARVLALAAAEKQKSGLFA